MSSPQMVRQVPVRQVLGRGTTPQVLVRQGRSRSPPGACGIRFVPRNERDVLDRKLRMPRRTVQSLRIRGGSSKFLLKSIGVLYLLALLDISISTKKFALFSVFGMTVAVCQRALSSW